MICCKYITTKAKGSKQGRSNVILGPKRNLNIGILSAFRENKIKLTKKIYKFPQSKVILYDVC